MKHQPNPDDPTRVTGVAVKGFPIRFEWQQGDWVRLFDKQVEQVQDDIARARAEERYIIYLSCPISPRGGGMSTTNVDIAGFTARWLMNAWGPRFWVLNPSAYQLESKQGRSLIYKFAEELGIKKERVDYLRANFAPIGGDYMRMWTRVLVEDGGDNVGGLFTAFYFLSPIDVQRFFGQNATSTLSAAAEEYFTRQYALNAEFRDYFSLEGADGTRPTDWQVAWQQRRDAFIRFYTMRASAMFSLGSHDEWNILVALNKQRIANPKYQIGEQITAYFDGKQVDPGAAEAPISPGYAVV